MNDFERERLFQQSWQRAWDHLALQAPAGLFEQLMAAYSEPQRHYHTLQHLAECLHHFESVISLAKAPGEVEIALWFHDAIYDVRGKENERRSADWAVKVLSENGATAQMCERVDALIMATLHDVMPADLDQQLLVDIDLAILGASPQRFEEYDGQVRAEYSWVLGFVYKMKRKMVLKGFLSRPVIFHTDVFRVKYEQLARFNLQRAAL